MNEVIKTGGEPGLPSIVSGGESLDIFEIMQRFRTDGSCEHLIKEALESLARTRASAPSPKERATEIVDGVYDHYVTAYRGEEERRMFIDRIASVISSTPEPSRETLEIVAEKIVSKLADTGYMNPEIALSAVGDIVEILRTETPRNWPSTPSDEVNQAVAEMRQQALRWRTNVCLVPQNQYSVARAYEECAEIVLKHLSATLSGDEVKQRAGGRVVDMAQHGGPTRNQLSEIKERVADGYEKVFRQADWGGMAHAMLGDLHFLLTFFNYPTPPDVEQGGKENP